MTDTTQQRDERHMRLALKLAAKARGHTSPNPMVGAVVVRRGEVVGRGFHRRAGQPHAEVEALADAGKKARGAELVVNLEPCSHVGRTGPCADCIIEAGIKRVVVGMRDPNPLVNGAGIRRLRRAGVEVACGVLEDACLELNEVFITYIQKKRPFVTFKAALTLDGHVAARTGHSQWVTGADARRHGHRLRAFHDAIMVGSGTVLADNPQLTCRGVRGGRDPVRVVLDSRLRTPPDARVMDPEGQSSASTWIFTSSRASAAKERALVGVGAKVFRVPKVAGGLDVAQVLALLYQQEISSVLLEGGPRLAGGFWQAGLIDRVAAFLAPKILGDPQGKPLLFGAPAERMTQAADLIGVRVRRLGRDLLVTGQVPAPEGDPRAAARCKKQS